MDAHLVCAFLQDLLKVEAKLLEKQQREKEEEDRQRRITVKLKERVRGGHQTLQKETYFIDSIRLASIIRLKVSDPLLLCQVDSHVSRDPSRLIRNTKGWDERMKHIGPSGGGPLMQMFHRSD